MSWGVYVLGGKCPGLSVQGVSDRWVCVLGVNVQGVNVQGVSDRGVCGLGVSVRGVHVWGVLSCNHFGYRSAMFPSIFLSSYCGEF